MFIYIINIKKNKYYYKKDIYYYEYKKTFYLKLIDTKI